MARNSIISFCFSGELNIDYLKFRVKFQILFLCLSLSFENGWRMKTECFENESRML